MCGIASYFARESVPGMNVFKKLFTWAEKRGTDGFGLIIVKRDRRDKENYLNNLVTYKSTSTYSECEEEAIKVVRDNLEIGDLLLAICRAAPEQEPPTSERNIQPLVNNECILIHNGSVSQKVYDRVKELSPAEYVSDIDSEAILHYYNICGRNIDHTMEYISGGVAALMYDWKKDCLYMINDFKPIAQSYIKGYGYFLASDNDCLGEIIQDVTDCGRDGICLWENFYHHYLSGGRIKELDLDSGFVRNIKYSPRYMTQNWDSNNPKPKEKELCLVAASGGLDSTLTLSMLKLAHYDNIIACHFKYGHRGQQCEESAITKVCKQLDIELKVFDIEDLVTGIDPTSMLIDPNAKITTGTREGLKKLDAWVCGRNMLFLTIMATFAEAQVMKDNYQTVHLLGGFLNLTESGHYPDNSEYFLSSFLEHAKYGTLIGNRLKPLFGLSNLMKSDQWTLVKEFALFDIVKNTISCDRPMFDVVVGRGESHAKNCSKDGMPACGSGLLSWWAAKMVGLDDMDIRKFYDVQDDDYKAHVPAHINEGHVLTKNIHKIIDRINFPQDKLNILHQQIVEIQEKL